MVGDVPRIEPKASKDTYYLKPTVFEYLRCGKRSLASKVHQGTQRLAGGHFSHRRVLNCLDLTTKTIRRGLLPSGVATTERPSRLQLNYPSRDSREFVQHCTATTV
jgi:hypothetical protein